MNTTQPTGAVRATETPISAAIEWFETAPPFKYVTGDWITENKRHIEAVRTLEREADRLREERDSLAGLLECQRADVTIRDERIAIQAAEIARLREDRDCLNWLQDRGYVAAHHNRHFEGRTANFGWSRERSNKDLRGAIKSALNPQKGGEL